MAESDLIRALEVLARRASPREIIEFAEASSAIRAAVIRHASRSTAVVTPLRGAMPVVWALEGLADYEAPTGATFLEIPIGVQRRLVGGRLHDRSPRPSQKRLILDRYIADWQAATGLPPYECSVVLLDEAQHGGTISTATRALRAIITGLGLNNDLVVIAALDSRRGADSEPKTAQFQALMANEVPDTLGITVRLPMFAIDVQPLLDQVVLEGDGANLDGIERRLSTARNSGAEAIFRTFGSLARSPAARREPDLAQRILGTLRVSGSATTHATTWLDGVLRAFDHAFPEDVEDVKGTMS